MTGIHQLLMTTFAGSASAGIFEYLIVASGGGGGAHGGSGGGAGG